jgi:hypothetical protein
MSSGMKSKSVHKRRKHPNCLNCDYTFGLADADEFCPSCGQENTDLHTGIGHWLMEIVEGILHFEGKFWITTKYLIAKPGILSKEFVAGHRTKFMPPVRMYLFVSFIFFLALGLRKEHKTRTEPESYIEQDKKLDEFWSTDMRMDDLASFSLGDFQVTRRELRHCYYRGDDALDSLLDAQSGSHGFIERALLKKMVKIEQEPDGVQAMGHNLLKAMSIIGFVLMPVYALLLNLFYYRKKLFYTEHFIFSIHSHTMLFAGGALFFAFGRISVFITLAIMLFLAVHHYISLKRFYGHSHIITSIKYLFLSAIYISIQIALFLIAFLGSVLLV